MFVLLKLEWYAMIGAAMLKRHVVVSDTYRDDISDGYSIPG